MEERFIDIAASVALCLEVAVALILVGAAAAAAVRPMRMLAVDEEALTIRKAVWLKFAGAIALALEFAACSCHHSIGERANP